MIYAQKVLIFHLGIEKTLVINVLMGYNMNPYKYIVKILSKYFWEELTNLWKNISLR